MPPASLHLNHLAQILSDTDAQISAHLLSHDVLADFFQTLAAARIRIDRADWQGRPLRTLLWHLPNVKPAGRTALTAYIVDQWTVHRSHRSVPAAVEPLADASAPAPAAMPDTPAVDPEGEAPDPAALPATADRPSFWATVPEPRRDWFDRLTDWVAAVLSLFRE